MTDADELRILRARLADLEAEAERLGNLAASPITYRIGEVYRQSVQPSEAGRFHACRPAELSAPGAEGSTCTLSVDSSRTFYVRVLRGSAAAGELLVAASADYRWHAEVDGDAPPEVVVRGCPCPASPVTLYMYSSAPISNLRMFQNSQLVYQAVPSGLAALGLGANAYLSDSTFPDGLTGDTFRYYFHCAGSSYLLTRIYEYSSYGSPYRDLTRYSWLVGMPGNACSPFALTNGRIYAGGDPSCVVEVTGTNVHGI